ncbi:hypothetical protein ABZS66_60945 [Dactylosporangium sp. NPDC005572]|uniref:hypothetical protein n=1 Tax=Dactylosporangium sp. NPDC005572 TaxID=3156889 RepID=UPI0033ABE160
MMQHVVGVDPQRTRTAVVLREGDGGSGGALPMVGDGFRRLVPNAVLPPDRWATPAAEALLDAAGGAPAADLARLARSWCCDPLSADFLAGLRERLFGYLGRLAPAARNGYRVAAVAAPGTETLLRQRFTDAGLADVLTVDPADALLARWLVDPARPPAGGIVVAVACGEAWTRVATYAVDQAAPRTARRLAASASTVEGGVTDLAGAVTAAVLGRCRQGVRSAELLAMLDGALELAGRLRSLRADDEVEWAGPLTERMFEPLRLSRQSLAGTPGVAESLAEVAGRVRAAVTVGGTTRPAALLVGGIGAVWPAVADGLTSLGPVWQSPEPEADLAVGAAWWPSLRHGVQRPETAEAAFAALAPATPRETVPAVAPQDSADIPPWLR